MCESDITDENSSSIMNPLPSRKIEEISKSGISIFLVANSNLSFYSLTQSLSHLKLQHANAPVTCTRPFATRGFQTLLSLI